MTNSIDRRTSEYYLAQLRADGPPLTAAEAELLERWANIQRAPERPRRHFPWLSLLAGACLWTVGILAILYGIWIMGL